MKKRLPLEEIYSFGDRVNRWLKKPKRIAETPVLSLGNLTTGGTGKTPAAIYFARLLQQLGYQVAILTRGYGGEVYKEGAVLSDGKSLFLTPEESGDEPYLMALNLPGVPLAVGRRRYENGLKLVRNHPVGLFILDDGFQHYQLERDCDIVLIDATNPFGNGYILPHGILREPPEALQRAHVVILTKSDLVEEEKLEEIIGKIDQFIDRKYIFKAVHKPVSLVKVPPEGGSVAGEVGEKLKGESLGLLKKKEIWALSGIGNHRAFEKTLYGLGVSTINALTYRDHYRYSERDLDSILKRISPEQIVVTTEKDWIRLQKYSQRLSTLKHLYYLKIDFSITSGEEGLKERITSLLFKA